MILLSIPFLYAAATEKPDAFAGQKTMNGFSLKQFEDFHVKWPLVTVRYREDTKEMRFTYANEIALKALKNKSQDYPDGAVFAKIGFMSEVDAAFPASLVPSGAKRYQFMVRDKKKFAETDGWGYALFNGDGETFNGDPHKNSLACAACHHIVPQRGYVFSEFVPFAPYVEKTFKQTGAKGPAVQPALLQFKKINRRDLDKKILPLIPEKFTQVFSLQGPLQKNIFEGTVNEIGPFLSQQSLKTNAASVLISDSAEVFAFAYPEESEQKCPAGQKRTIVGRSLKVAEKRENNSDELVLKVVSYCERLPSS